VFYDLTTVRIHGEGSVKDDLRAYGMNKERGGIARQFVLGVVQTAEGLIATRRSPSRCSAVPPPSSSARNSPPGKSTGTAPSHGFAPASTKSAADSDQAAAPQ
ncbi:MAG: hypothetical protein ACXIUV_11660, partial [Alkalilacustris sp.]